MTKNTHELLHLNKSTEFGIEINNNLKSASQYLLKKAEEKLLDALEKIQDIQDARDAMQDIAIGDYVKLRDGSYRMVATMSPAEKKLQLYPDQGHYCCLFESGDASASGTLDEPISVNSLELTDEKKKVYHGLFFLMLAQIKVLILTLILKCGK